MPLIIIRLHPEEPIAGSAFTSYLDGLTITAFDVSFDNPDGTQIGEAQYLPLPDNPLGQIPPPLDSNTQIVQHYRSPNPFDPPEPQAVATAVVEIAVPPAGTEYRTADIRLEITRSGTEIAHNQNYYNVPISSAALPANPETFPNLQPTSLHLALPSSGQSSPTVILPENGAAPNFDALRTAVEDVLNAEPGNLSDIADLTLDQCRHIAYEIIWDRDAYPLPEPNRSLEQIYTGPQAADSDDERDRQVFEGALLTYYTTHNADADRLTNFVFALSAAIWCEEQSRAANRVGFHFPVFPNDPNKIAKVILTGVGGAALDPAFEVPAAYFYALTAVLPPQVKREQRFKLVTLDAEAQAIAEFEQAIDERIISEPPGINRFQAARRLRALGSAEETGTAECEIDPTEPDHDAVRGLVTNWLASPETDINVFWGALSAADTAGHLDIVLCAITQAHRPLVNIIKTHPAPPPPPAPPAPPAPPPPPSFGEGVSTVNALSTKTNENWQALFSADSSWLPDFTKPGTTEERTQAFIRHLRRFFEVGNEPAEPISPAANSLPSLGRSANPLDALLANYPGGFSFIGWDDDQLASTLDTIFPGDPTTQEQFTEWLFCIQQILLLAGGAGGISGDGPINIQFSVMEALWARGITSRDIIARFDALEGFKSALVGSVAYDYAEQIWNNAQIPGSNSPAEPSGFRPVNPDGSIINCIPPAHRSPLGPVAYLQELLHVSAASTCETLFPPGIEETVGALLSDGRGHLGDLLASKANLEVPLPLIDIVNESLEHMVANDAESGAVYNTASDQVDGHELTSNPSPSEETYLHDPETLLEVLPEHSTPATPTAQQAAYDILRNDFSACTLPYSQPLDVACTYLEQLGTSRFATMRHFREDITEFVLNPANEPAAFQTHLWRYPIRIETAIEYLKITPEEHRFLFQERLSNAVNPPSERLAVYQFFGFLTKHDEFQREWVEVVLQLSEFLERTCLTYCEFLELWESKFIEFGLRGRDEGFPECEPCCLDHLIIEFESSTDPAQLLGQLIVFIRLWRILQAIPNANYTFTELRDICEVLQLFNGTAINPDFIRQLVAFQMLRDDFQLSLTDGSAPNSSNTGADHLHLLAFWVPDAARQAWAIEHLLYQIQQYALDTYHCECREPEFIKLIEANLDAISALVGFDPTNPSDAWDAHPTHTLRFAEILAKIYASDFGVGELLFLFTNHDHLHGDDPFPLQTDNEAHDFPLSLPDDSDRHSLWALRRKLMDIDVSDEAAQQWTWARMEAALIDELGFSAAPGNNPWLSLGQHFFPTILADSGIAVSPLQQQYRVALEETAERMWNTPPEGPFRYDANAAEPELSELWTQLPLTDEAVLAKLSRIRQLHPPEISAVRDLYFLPRVDLAHFAYIFNNFREAEEKLIQEPDEMTRWQWFQLEFARFYQRCQVIAEHLANHVTEVTSSPDQAEAEVAKLLLRNLWADENRATTPWENDNGESPSVTWQPQPIGGAFAALLGLTGTGLLAEYRDLHGNLRWREVRGALEAFGTEENSWNAPVPTILPEMGLTFSAEQLRFAAVRNGFALANVDGAPLGGAEPFMLHWQGLLLIEQGGQYGFSAGAPTIPGELADFESIDQSHRWRITLRRGQRTWVLLAHDWPHEEAPAACSAPIDLKAGFYELEIELERQPLLFDGPEDVCPQTTGFQLKYDGPDAEDDWSAIRHNKLFQPQKDATLAAGLERAGAAQTLLATHYTSTIRDMRRTYQRAFKAMLLAHRLQLSAQQISDGGQSELGYMLAHPENFLGQAYYRDGGAFTTHRANFELNFLPVLDNYNPPAKTPTIQDQRVVPTPQRQQAMFDWWERLFDYTVMRRETQRAHEQPVWFAFHESQEFHPDQPADLVRHFGIDLRHSDLVLRYYEDYLVSSTDLEDDRWAVRVWQSEKWIRALLKRFYPLDIRAARPDLWASDDPSASVTAFGTTDSGNHNLTQFYRDGCIENGEPRRCKEIKRLNDALRQRGRTALIAYLTHLSRVPLPWGGFATEAKHLSELLLLDVEAGICQKASRIEEAVTAVHTFIQRARLGLEPGFAISSDFIRAWERHFATFRTWEACKRRLIYRENWIEWEELQEAQQIEAFQFLESELRRATLTMPVPGGLTYWSGDHPPSHPGVSLLQHREPSTIQFLNPAPQGLGLMGTPDRHARPTWLAPVQAETMIDRPQNGEGGEGGEGGGGEGGEGGEGENPDPILFAVANAGQQGGTTNLPMWLQAAVRLGTKFVRVAAAGIPPASTTFTPKCNSVDTSTCCSVCGKVHPALMDEYYFWLEESRYYAAQEYDAASNAGEQRGGAINQVAEWGARADNPQTDWHRAEQLPGLLYWQPKRMVHLRWCRVHNGEFQQPRQSYDGVRLSEGTAGADPQLTFVGRQGDSLYFRVEGGQAPVGVPAPPSSNGDGDGGSVSPTLFPGFRYDLPLDEAVVIPQVVNPPLPEPFGGLAAFPFFAWFSPGQPLLPPSMFSVAIAVAGQLRTHCQFEAALKWYESAYPPLFHNNTWRICPPREPQQPEPAGDESVPGAADTIAGALDTSEGALEDTLLFALSEGGNPFAVVLPTDEDETCCCASGPVSEDRVKQRVILMHYLETLLQWGDALMREHTPEAFQQARLVFETASKILGKTPITVLAEENALPVVTVARFQPDCAPINPRLLCLYTQTSDRLALIHNCLNAKRLKNGRPKLDMPYFGNDTIRDCWQNAKDACAEEQIWCLPQSPYRFMVLIQKAQEIASDVRTLGAALLAAYEKGDAEYLSTMRATHERQLLNLALEIRQHQWREADWQVQALRKTKEIAQTRLQYYRNLIINGLNAGEAQYEPLTISSNALKTAGNISTAIGQAMNLIPDPHVGFPSNFVKLPPGEKLSSIFAAAGTISNVVADILSTVASLGLTKAGWERREDEWEHQVDVLGIEIEQIERQILAAERRRDMALHELNNHQQLLENAGEIHDFLRDKFSNHALYLWMQQETAAMHYQMYELALHCAQQAQRAFNFERGHTARQFLPTDIWDNLHEGLLAGERLQLALRQMEKAYYDENVREYELTKHISLRLHFPTAFLQLKTTGYCEIDVPEWLFDLDYPGHYMRRIKNVTMTIPCVVGPYTGVHCRLTLLSSKTRVDPRLIEPPHTCCNDEKWKNGYPAMPDDSRIVSIYGATEAIATSTGQNDSGLFELNFRDERYLPFEYSGAVSRWRIELPPENNHFDMETLSDLVLHLNFMAREGGEKIRQAANECAQHYLPGTGIRVFDVKHEFPDGWHKFVGAGVQESTSRELGIRLSRGMFPYRLGNKNIGVNRLEVLFKAPGADPSAHHIVEFLVGQKTGQIQEEKCDCDIHSVVCIANASWPGFFHGALEIDFGTIQPSGYQNLGVFKFPADIGEVTETYLFCRYAFL